MAAPANLIINPKSGTNNTGYQVGSGTLSRTTTLTSGTWGTTTGSIITCNSTAGGNFYIGPANYNAGSVITGVDFSWTLEFTASVNDSTMYVYLYEYNSSGTALTATGFGPYTVTANTPITVSGAFTVVNAATTQLLPLAVCGTPVVNKTMTVTRVRLDRIYNPKLEYADGSTTGWSWSSTADASQSNSTTITNQVSSKDSITLTDVISGNTATLSTSDTATGTDTRTGNPYAPNTTDTAAVTESTSSFWNNAQPSLFGNNWANDVAGTTLSNGTDVVSDSGPDVVAYVPDGSSASTTGSGLTVSWATGNSTTSQAVYLDQVTNYVIKYITATWSWGTGADLNYASVCLATWDTAYPIFGGTGNAQVHLSIARSGWQYYVLDGSQQALISLKSGTFTTALSANGTKYTCTVSISGNTATLYLPDGTTSTVTDSRIGSYQGTTNCFEFYRVNNTYTAPMTLYSNYAGPGYNVTARDLATFSDSSSVTQGGFPTASEIFAFTESSSLVVSVVTSDSAIQSETRLSSASTITSDTGTFGESSSNAAFISASDSATGTDTSAPINSANQLATADMFAMADTSQVVAFISVSDSATQTDSRAGSNQTSVSDTGSQSESSQINLNRSDSLSLTDLSNQIGQARSDSFAISDTSVIDLSGTDTGSFSENKSFSVLAGDIFTFTESYLPMSNYVYTSDTFILVESTLGSNFQYSVSDVFIVTEFATISEITVPTKDVVTYPTYLRGNSLTRIIVQDHFTREIIHWDLPVDNVMITYVLTGPNLFSATLSSEMKSVANLNPQLTPDRTWIHVEQGGSIIGSFLMTPFIDTPGMQTRQIEGEGFSSYPSWIIYQGPSYVGIRVDPAVMIKKIWDHIQSYDDGNIGVNLTALSTPIRIGYPQTELGYTTAAGVETQVPNPGPYTLNYWSDMNCGDEIKKLCQETPIEFLEYSAWNYQKSDIDHWISFGYPRVGSKRDDLIFREGENIDQLIPSYQESQENYASEVYVIGAGNGPMAIRAVKSGRIGRIRKTKVIQDQTITRLEQAQSIASFEYNRLSGSRFLIQNVTIDLTHPNTRFGTFNCGDDIYVQCYIPYVGEVTRWYRIVSYQYNLYTQEALLNLEPSESFTYGNENVNPTSYMPTSGFAISSHQLYFGYSVYQQNPNNYEIISTAELSDDMAEVNKSTTIINVAQQMDFFGGLPAGYLYVCIVNPDKSVPYYLIKESQFDETKHNLIAGKTTEGGYYFGDGIFFVTPNGDMYGERPHQTSYLQLQPIIIPNMAALAQRTLNAYMQNPAQISEGLEFPGWDAGGANVYLRYNLCRIYYGWNGTHTAAGPGPELPGIMRDLITGYIYVE